MSRVFASNAGSSASKIIAEPGFVSIENHQGRLRLSFRYEGKRQALVIGLPDSVVNRM
ncbi:MAG: DUF3596 domain-containing protein [Phormidesmis sp.]